MDISALQSSLIAKSDINNACYIQQYDAAFLKKAKSATYVTLNNKTKTLFLLILIHLSLCMYLCILSCFM